MKEEQASSSCYYFLTYLIIHHLILCNQGGRDCHPSCARRAARASTPRRARQKCATSTPPPASRAPRRSSCACTTRRTRSAARGAPPRRRLPTAAGASAAALLTHARPPHARAAHAGHLRSQAHTATRRHHKLPDHAPRCRACSFCTPTDQLTHVYASAGAGMAACAAGARLPWPSSGAPGSPTAASLDQCKAACDEVALRASSPLAACRAFLYSGARRQG